MTVTSWRLSDDDIPVVVLFGLFAVFACIIPPQADTFYHLRSGQTMWESGQLLDRELFSHTAYGRPLENHWWLSQLLFYLLYRLGGPFLLTIAVGACGLAAVVMSWRLTRGSAEARLVLLFALLLILPQWSLRPQVFSMFLLMATLRLTLSRRMLWTIAVLLVWANAHALVIFGIALVGLAALDAVLWRSGSPAPQVTATLAAAAVPVLTPLGVHYWPRVLETVRTSRQLGIQEYQSALTAGMDTAGYWLLLGALIVALLRARRRLAALQREDRILLFAAGVFAIAALISRRNGAFFVLVAVPVLSRLWAESQTRRPRPAPWPGYVLLGIAAAAGALFVAHHWREGASRAQWRPMTSEAIAAVRTCSDPLYNDFDDGGALMWFVPQRRVFVDGRVEAYPSDFILRAARASRSGEYEPLFTEFHIRCAVVRPGTPVADRLIKDVAVQRRFADERWMVFERPPSEP